MKPQLLTAKAKGWLTKDGARLVKDGDIQAAVLFVTPGRQVHADRVKGIQNASEFFHMPESPAPQPVAAEPERKKR